MSFLTALYKSYEYAEEHGMIGKLDDGHLILPIYHNSMRSNGKNIVEVLLDKDSKLIDAKFIEEGEVTIFPVTEDSVSRSSGPAPHPLFDNFNYIIQDGSKKSELYIKGLESWIEYSEDDFLKIVYKFIKTSNIFANILNKLFSDYTIIGGKEVSYIEINDKKKKEAKLDFGKVFMTFKIKSYEGLRDVSLSENKNLQEEFIEYTRKQNKEDNSAIEVICNISGKKDYLCTKHRPLIGSAKLVSQITANDVNYKGRFINPDETIKIGKESSQKIMLMAKSLLDGPKTSRWLGETTYAISWFSDDIKNESDFNISKQINIIQYLIKNQSKKTYDNDEESNYLKISDEKSKDILRSLTSGKLLFNDDSRYYIAIIDKISNGRVACKYFREMKGSKLRENLEKWQENYHWYSYSEKIGNYEATPSPKTFIEAAYGVERDGKLEVSKKSFLTSQYRNIIASIVEGKNMPANITKSLELCIRKRLSYDDVWPRVKFCALAGLRDREGRKDNMLDRNETDRSYLYGRLLALYERLEAITYDNDSQRITNAEKLWNSFVNKPVTINFRLRNLLKPYEKKLKSSENKMGLFTMIKKDITQVTDMIAYNYGLDSHESNKPLGPNFIFGYEAQMSDLFTKKSDKTKGDDENDK